MVKYMNRNNLLHMDKCAAYVTVSITLAQCVCHQLLTRKHSLTRKPKSYELKRQTLHAEDKSNSERESELFIYR